MFLDELKFFCVNCMGLHTVTHGVEYLRLVVDLWVG